MSVMTSPQRYVDKTATRQGELISILSPKEPQDCLVVVRNRDLGKHGLNVRRNKLFLL